MNLYLFFIIFIIGWLFMITQAAKRSKRIKKHLIKLVWGFWAVWVLVMHVSVESIRDRTMIQNKKLLESKAISFNTFQEYHKERNGLNALLEIGDEEFYSFTTTDGRKYQIGASSIVKQVENPGQVMIYQADVYEGYRYFYLFKMKNKYLYELIE